MGQGDRDWCDEKDDSCSREELELQEYLNEQRFLHREQMVFVLCRLAVQHLIFAISRG